MKKTRYFVFCITQRLLHHLQNRAHFQIALVILHRMVYRNIDFSHVLPHFLIPIFLVNSASITFGLNLRRVVPRWCQFFMMPLDSPELGLQPQGVLYSGIQTSFDRKNWKTKKVWNSNFLSRITFQVLYQFSIWNKIQIHLIISNRLIYKNFDFDKFNIYSTVNSRYSAIEGAGKKSHYIESRTKSRVAFIDLIVHETLWISAVFRP